MWIESICCCFIKKGKKVKQTNKKLINILCNSFNLCLLHTYKNGLQF